MPTLRLTDAAVKKLKIPETGRTEYWDSHTRGFGLRVSASGVRSWVLITRSLQAGEWKQQRVTLGTYPALSLAEARGKATEAKAAAKTGTDPAEAVKEERQKLQDDSRNTFSTVRDEFLTKYRGRQNRRPAPATLDQMKRVLGGDDFAAWADLPMAKITRRDILDGLDTIVSRGAETMANRSLAYLKILFGWSVQRGIIDANPAADIKKPGTETSRDRVLSADELRAIWKATEGDSQFNDIARLLMLTGQRLNEVAQMRWSEIDTDNRTWTLPAAKGDERRTKNARAHVVPLTDAMIEILETRKTQQKALVRKDKPMPALVFTTTGTTAYSGFSKAKERLDKAVSASMEGVEHWTLHDIRRSVATHMAEDLRIAPHIIEAVLNHVSGSKGGIAGVYNRAQHLDERRDALEAWSRHLLTLVGVRETGNVVELRREAANA